jgi:hypothetical protein
MTLNDPSRAGAVFVSELPIRGMTFSAVWVSDDKEVISFRTIDGTLYRLQHDAECCEHVVVDQIDGDLKDLTGAPLLLADERYIEPRDADGKFKDAGELGFQTWTFYHFATIHGYVTVRWSGATSGAYSARVTLRRCRSKSEFGERMQDDQWQPASVTGHTES